MIIEFFGFPGSGKTTIVNQLFERDNYRYKRGTLDHLGTLRRIIGKTWFSTFCLFLNPRFYVNNVMFLVIKGESRSFKDFLNITYLYSRYWIFRNSNALVVFDQGLVQGYWSIQSFVNNGSNLSTKELFNTVDRIIVLELDRKHSLKRLALRRNGKSRVENGKYSKIDFYYEKLEEIKSRLIDWGKELIILEGLQDPANNALVIEHFIDLQK